MMFLFEGLIFRLPFHFPGIFQKISGQKCKVAFPFPSQGNNLPFVTQPTQVLLEKVGFGSFLVFAFFTLMALFLAVWIPETKNLPLEEIESLRG